MSAEVETDADTGEEIIYFLRTYYRRHDAILLKVPIHYLMLRDAKTKQFIRRLIGVEQRMFMVIDYSEEEAKKGNPLYLDAVGVHALSPEMFAERDRHMEILKSLLAGKVGDYFGQYVVVELLNDAGEEYGSELRIELTTTIVVMVHKKPRTRTVVNERVWYWSLVWKHRKEEAPKSLEKVDLK